VVALVRTPDKAGALRDLGVTIAEGDITQRDSLRAPMTGVDGVFHCAAWYKIGAPASDAAQAERINVDGTRNVLETMRDLRIAKGVYTSTLAVFSDTGGREVDETHFHPGPFLSVYERTKWRAHYDVALRLIADGLPLVIVQPGAIYGPGDTSGLRAFFRQYLDGTLRAVPAKTAFSWGYIDDVARAHILAMSAGRAGETYIVAGPSHTMVDALRMAEQITGIAPPSFQAPPGLLKAAAAVTGLIGRVVPLPPALTAEGLRTLAGVTYLGSNAKAGRALGYAPRPLIDGLRDMLAREARPLA
jgi:nucleoside-diphosphate-sugar epimerase